MVLMLLEGIAAWKNKFRMHVGYLNSELLVSLKEEVNEAGHSIYKVKLESSIYSDMTGVIWEINRELTENRQRDLLNEILMILNKEFPNHEVHIAETVVLA